MISLFTEIGAEYVRMEKGKEWKSKGGGDKADHVLCQGMITMRKNDSKRS